LKIISLALLILSLFTGCSSTPEQPTDERQTTFSNAITDSDYAKLIDLYTVKDEKYSGFYSSFQYYSTILNASVLEAQLALKAKDFKWPRENYFAEKEKVSESLSRESKFFVSFYSPITENDNLDSNKTIWKLWLEVDGVRYEGIASKAVGILAQHQRLYPYHTRFFTPYVLTFKVPMGKTQATSPKLIITGPIGSSEVTFTASSQDLR
jgi:hypothetical protein